MAGRPTDYLPEYCDRVIEWGKDGSTQTVLNGEHVQRSRLRVDSRKWLLSKLKPERYGDKLQHSGPGGGPVQHAHAIEIVIVDPAEDPAKG